MAYEFKYSLKSAPQARTDGSGYVDHQIEAVYSEDEGETWQVVPARSKTISVPAQNAIDALDLPTNSQKITAYKGLLADNLNYTPVPLVGWDIPSMTLMLDNNALATTAVSDFDEFRTGLGLEYPIRFNM